MENQFELNQFEDGSKPKLGSETSFDTSDCVINTSLASVTTINDNPCFKTVGSPKSLF